MALKQAKSKVGEAVVDAIIFDEDVAFAVEGRASKPNHAISLTEATLQTFGRVVAPFT